MDTIQLIYLSLHINDNKNTNFSMAELGLLISSYKFGE